MLFRITVESLQNRRLFLHSVEFWSSEEEEKGALENCTPPLSPLLLQIMHASNPFEMSLKHLKNKKHW